MHEYDCHGLDAVGHRAFELRANRREVQITLGSAVGAHPLVDLDDALEQHLRLDDVLGKNLRPRLITDAQSVSKTLGR